MYILTLKLMRIHKSLLLWNSNALHILSVCVCTLSYPASKVHAPYYTVIYGLSHSARNFPLYFS